MKRWGRRRADKVFIIQLILAMTGVAIGYGLEYALKIMEPGEFHKLVGGR